MQQRPADFARYCGELEWPLADAHERLIEIFEKPLGEPGSLLVVPTRGALKIGLSEWPNDERARHLVQWRLSNFLRRRS